ncbi:MAG TPA: DUF3299 domain-containing protein [Tepidisphaeraceae bacterium]|nr:DUF3299 domain-containing protein [Tepidisphaeraceae bacterium]
MSLLICGAALAQTAQSTNPSGLEVAANEAFGAGRYAVALPMLMTLADKYKDQADRLGPINERISVCQKQIAANASAPATQPAAPDGILTSAEARKPHVRPADGKVLELAIKELGNFDYDAEHGGNIPKDVTALTGSMIRLHGFMIPMDQADRITRFALVPSLFACCFGQPPQIQHTIVVQCPTGKAVSYYPDEINVEGKLTVDEKKEDGFIVSIFEMDATSVKPTAK